MKKRMKQNLLFLEVLLLMSLGLACSHKVKDRKTMAEIDVVEFEVNNVIEYTVDEEGYLYTAGNMKINEDFTFESIPTYINKYDMEGNLVYTHEFEKDAFINSMAAHGNTLYYTMQGYNQEGHCIELYSYDMETGIQEKLCEFCNMEDAKQLVYLEDRIYLLGSKYLLSGFFSSMNQEEAYQSKGEKLVYYSLSDQTIYQIGIDIPISISKSDDETLMIYGYLENEGYCLLKYEPKQDSVRVVGTFDSGNFEYFATCNQGEDIIYTYNKNSRGLVMSNLSSLGEEAELYLDATPINFGLYHVNGHVYFMNNAMNLMRLSLDSIERENRVIRYISPGYSPNAPYGCGYKMERTELELDKFTLKVLAQDKDYDLCLVDSFYDTSYNIRKNGVFYPLNEVEGIQEYLDSCFPYVKEAATDENGDIWMLPIVVDIPGIMVNEDVIEKHQLDIKNNMTYEEFYKIQENMTEENYEKSHGNSSAVYYSFFNQYFNTYETVENEVYESKLKLFQQYDSYMADRYNANLQWRSGDFIYYLIRTNYEYEYILKDLAKDYYYESSEYIKMPELNLKLYSMPKIKESDKNMGTCVFLAVNPNSDNLDETLAYLADYISYCMNKEETPLYFHSPIPEEGTLSKSIYDLYKNGAIGFTLDHDLYWEGFDDVLDGKVDTKVYIEEAERKLSTYINE